MTEHTKTDSKDRIEKIQKEIDSDHFNTMNDLLFKFTFGREERKHITIDFLNTVLRKSLGHLIKDITFIPTEQIPQNEADKTSLFDVACELDTGEHVDVEVQVINHKNMRQRAMMYCAEMYVNGLPAGEDYRNAHHALTINILAFTLLPQKSPHAVYSMNNLESGDVLDKGMEVHFLEIPKFLRAGKKAIMDLTKLERWLSYFANRLSRQEKKELTMLDPAISDAYDAARIFFQNEEEHMNYIKREIDLMDYRADIQDAEERGEKRGEKRGEERGIKIGEERGEERGIKIGEKRLLRLMQLLTAQNRNDDISRIMTDKAYLQELYRAYSI